MIALIIAAVFSIQIHSLLFEVSSFEHKIRWDTSQSKTFNLEVNKSLTASRDLEVLLKKDLKSTARQLDDLSDSLDRIIIETNKMPDVLEKRLILRDISTIKSYIIQMIVEAIQ